MRSRIQFDNDDDFRDREDEAPQVVAGIGVSEEEASEYVQKNLVKYSEGKDGIDSDKPEDERTPEEIEAENAGKEAQTRITSLFILLLEGYIL